jgi:hypothetical protein
MPQLPKRTTNTRQGLGYPPETHASLLRHSMEGRNRALEVMDAALSAGRCDMAVVSLVHAAQADGHLQADRAGAGFARKADDTILRAQKRIDRVCMFLRLGHRRSVQAGPKR